MIIQRSYVNLVWRYFCDMSSSECSRCWDNILGDIWKEKLCFFWISKIGLGYLYQWCNKTFTNVCVGVCVIVTKGIVCDSNSIFFCDMNQNIWTQNIIYKISVNSNFTFASYAWLCALALLRRLLFQNKSHQWEFMWKLLLFHNEMISA